VRRAIWLLMAAALAPAQRETTFEGRRALVIENDRIELLLLPQGGAFASLVLKDDPERMNPMWNPLRLARAAGQDVNAVTSIGHFVCVDGFGPVSAEERAAGLANHGEAHRQPWETVNVSKAGGRQRFVFRAKLPAVQEVFTRTVELADGEQAVSVEGELESLLPFDRPVSWAEHATIGPPFLEAERTVIDVPAGRCMTRPARARSASVPRRTVPEKEFTWPMAPAASGGVADMRRMPVGHNSMDHTGCALDPHRELAYVTALHLDKRLLLGYVWRREEFPWIQKWMNYPAAAERTALGLEFGTQPFDIPRREAVDMGRLFDLPTFRWLPAKSRVRARFVMFYARVPEGFAQVDELEEKEGGLVVRDLRNGKVVQVKLAGGVGGR
jgi:hypothetical protein